jgi:hypothetical protein
VRKVECCVFVLEIRKCPLEGGKHPPRVSLSQWQVSDDLECSIESNSVIAVRLNYAVEIRVGSFRSREFMASGSALISFSETFCVSIGQPSL